MNPEFWQTLFIFLAIFLICREIVCWYWKQNEQVKLLKEIRDLLAGQGAAGSYQKEKTKSFFNGFKQGSKKGQSTQIIKEKRCGNCGQFTSKDMTVCNKCGQKLH